jgi:uncharacterized iron-regulated membrane protein
MTLQKTIDSDLTRQRHRPVQRRRKPVRRVLIVTHRWISLILGLALLVITTSGAILLYGQPLHRLLNADAYEATEGSRQVSFEEAAEIVAEREPDFAPTSVFSADGVLQVTDFDISHNVDAVTGEYLGEVKPVPAWLSLLENAHYCFFACEDQPGYVAMLAKEVPGTGWLGFDGARQSYGAFTLLIGALMLTYVTLTGLWLWMPRPSRWKSGFTVRWRRGRFARDADLHKVVGMAALPLLLIWGVTGAGFESELIGKGWYAATPGDIVEAPVVTSAKGDGPDIGADQAIAAARQETDNLDVVGIDIPAVVSSDDYDETAVYTVWLQRGYDPYGHSDYPGDVGVSVDRRSSAATVTFGVAERSVSQEIWEDWNYPTHAGFVVNEWWRVLWLILGLSPLLLAVTGVSTWLVRRRTRITRKQAAAGRSASTSMDASSTVDPRDDVVAERR